MEKRLMNNWCVKNDGSLLFKNTVVRHLNKKWKTATPVLRGADSGYYYGIWNDDIYVDIVRPVACKKLSIPKFCKLTGCLTDIVQITIDDICRLNPDSFITSGQIIAYMEERFGVRMKPVDLRESIHDIRCAGRIKNLVANTRGYWIAKNTVEVQKYLVDLQYRAMRIHELQAAIKAQAEETFGQQIQIPLE